MAGVRNARTPRSEAMNDKRYVFNHTRRAFLAHDVTVANTHLKRLVGLLFTRASAFMPGRGLWIVPCHGVHTFGMRFPIDVLYLDEDYTVVHIDEIVPAWRVTRLVLNAKS